MKSCHKCGKIVANSTLSCPRCGSYMFDTESGDTEGFFSEMLNIFMQRNPKLFLFIAVPIIIGFFALIVWFFLR